MDSPELPQGVRPCTPPETVPAFHVNHFVSVPDQLNFRLAERFAPTSWNNPVCFGWTDRRSLIGALQKLKRPAGCISRNNQFQKVKRVQKDNDAN